MQNNMQVWLESSTTTFNLNSHDEGVYLVSDLDGLTSLPSIRTSQGVNAGTDGGWTSAQAFDARLIDVNIVIANEDVSIVESKRRTLNSLLAQSRKETLKLHFISEAGMEYVINVRVMNVSGALTNILKKQELLIQLRADDPIIYGAQTGEGADATLTVQQASGGFEIPFDIPLIISGGTDKTNVENLGSEDVYPVIKMTGPLHNPTVVNETQNAEIGVNADLGDMEWRGYEDFSLYGNTTQKTLSGKNLLPIINSTASNYGITAKIENGILTVNGKTTSACIIKLTNGVDIAAGSSPSASWIAETMPISDLDGKTISLDYESGTPPAASTAFRIYSTTTTHLRQWYPTSTDQTYTWDESTDAPSCFCLFINSGITYSNYKIALQIEAGSTATPLEQYCGGIPSPNPDFPQTVNVVSGEQTVKITGKNLFDNSLLAKGSVTVTDGVATGTAQQFYQAWNGTDGLLNHYPNQQVTVSAEAYTDGNDSTSATNGLRIRVLYTDGTSDYATWLNSTSSYAMQKVITNSSKTISSIVITYGSSASNIWHLKNVQIELGSVATPTYEPYQGQSYELNLGKNLFDISKVLTNGNNTLINNGDGTLTIKGLAIPAATPNTLADYCPQLKEGDVATLSATTTSTQKYIYLYGANQSWNFGASKTITSAMLQSYVAWYGTAGGTVEDTISNVQIELGTQATTYSAYKTPIELCKINTAQDYIYKDGGKWYKHAEIAYIDMADIPSSSYGYTNGCFQANVGSIPDKEPSTDALSDYFIFNPVQSLITSKLANGEFGFNTQGRLTVKYDTLTSKDNWTTWLGSHSVLIYYVLATPTDTEITDSELLGQLDAITDYAPYFGEEQNVFLIPSAGAQGTLIIGAPNEPKPADEVLIDTQMKTVTFNGQNIYNKLTEGSSFFTLAPGDNTMYLTSDVASDTGKAEIKFKQGFISI